MNIFQILAANFLALISIVSGLFHPALQMNVTPVQTNLNPLTIQSMKAKSYPGSDVIVEQTLSPGNNYSRYIVSFMSDGLKEYAYLTIPKTRKPTQGFPVIIFNHGYQVPELYTPDGNYIAYMDALAKSGYIIFKPDYRGNGKSEGSPTSSYFSPDYITDDMNAISSVKKMPIVDSKTIGVWGHSMGGMISLKVTEISKDVKAVVIWGGVVGSYNDIIYNWQDKVSYKPVAEDLMLRYKNLSSLEGIYGTPVTNPTFWNSVDPISYLKDIKAPIQIDVGLADNQVPPSFSKGLYTKLKADGKVVEYYEYPGANHDINQSFTLAMKRTIDFFNSYLK
jgi:dipeptidyl aminopeptidase/acylaminoacyl peptidase